MLIVVLMVVGWKHTRGGVIMIVQCSQLQNLYHVVRSKVIE